MLWVHFVNELFFSDIFIHLRCLSHDIKFLLRILVNVHLTGRVYKVTLSPSECLREVNKVFVVNIILEILPVRYHLRGGHT